MRWKRVERFKNWDWPGMRTRTMLVERRYVSLHSLYCPLGLVVLNGFQMPAASAVVSAFGKRMSVSALMWRKNATVSILEWWHIK